MSNDSVNTVTQEQRKVNSDSQINSVGIWNSMTWYAREMPLPISCPNYYLHYTENPSKAIFIAQLVYWQEIATKDYKAGNRKNDWFFKTKKEWKQEICISASTLERFEREFVEEGWLEVTLHRAYARPTVHYRVNLDKLFIKMVNNLNGKGLLVKAETVDRRKARQKARQKNEGR